MRLVIETQDYENYNAHNGFDGTYRWKAKGGSTYVIDLGNKFNIFGADAEIDNILVQANGIFGIERDDDYYQINVISTEVIGDNEKTYSEARDDEFDADYGTRDVRYWPQVLNVETKTCTMKFRGCNGKLYQRTWVYDNGDIVEGSYKEEELA